MLAVTVETAKNISLGVLVGLLLLGYLAVKITKSVTQKAFTLLITAGIALGVWTQRANVAECADKVRDQALAGGVPATSCRFFGSDVEISIPGTTLP